MMLVGFFFFRFLLVFYNKWILRAWKIAKFLMLLNGKNEMSRFCWLVVSSLQRLAVREKRLNIAVGTRHPREWLMLPLMAAAVYATMKAKERRTKRKSKWKN